VSQDNTAQTQVAETSTQETETFIRQVRTRTRRKYAPEDKIRIVLEGFRRKVTISDLCRRGGSSRAYSMPGPRNPWRRVKSVSGMEQPATGHLDHRPPGLISG